jgi:hypothetical protein
LKALDVLHHFRKEFLVMVFNNFLRRGTMLILAVTIFALFGLSATANGNNPEQRPSDSWGFTFFPDGSLVSRFEIFPCPVGRHFSIKEPAAGAALQSHCNEVPLIVPWRLIVPPNFGAINTTAPDSPFGGPVRAAPLDRMIYKNDKGGGPLLPITREPNRPLAGFGEVPSPRIGNIEPPVVRAVPVEPTTAPSPIIKPPNEYISDDTVEGQTSGDIASVPQPQPIGDDIAEPAVAIAGGGWIETPINGPEADGVLPSGDDWTPYGVNEDYSPCLFLITLLSAQDADVSDGRLPKTPSGVNRPDAGKVSVAIINSERIGGRQKIATTPRNVPGEPPDRQEDHPFVPLNSAGDKVILNGVPHIDQGKVFHKTQHKATDINFALRPLTQNSPRTKEGGIYVIQRCSAQPRAPSVDERYV